jgi:hypothetical protein
MLFLFGRFGQPVKLALGVVLLAAGIVLHQTLAVVAGGVLLLWGVVALFGGSHHGDSRHGGSGRGETS